MIIYGLVILIALSVLAFLIYFDVLDLGTYLPDTCNLGGTGDLKCEEMKLGTTNFELGIRNTGKRPIQSLAVTVTDDQGTHFSTITGSAMTLDGTPISATNVLAPGDVAKISLPVTTAKSGKVLQGTLKTTYKYKDGAITQESSGNIRLKAVG